MYAYMSEFCKAIQKIIQHVLKEESSWPFERRINYFRNTHADSKRFVQGHKHVRLDTKAVTADMTASTDANDEQRHHGVTYKKATSGTC